MNVCEWREDGRLAAISKHLIILVFLPVCEAYHRVLPLRQGSRSTQVYVKPSDIFPTYAIVVLNITYLRIFTQDSLVLKHYSYITILWGTNEFSGVYVLL